MGNKIARFYWKIYRRILIVRDVIRGVDFARNHSMEELGFSTDIGVEYSATPSYDLKKIFGKYDIQNADRIIDFGSGKGAAMATMAAFPFQLIHGVEISEDLSSIANKNFRKLGIQNARVFQADAREFKKLDQYNYFYFFNPFPTLVLQSVIQNIKDSCTRKPRKITLVYYNPCYQEAMECYPALKLVDQYMGRYFEVAIYQN